MEPQDFLQLSAANSLPTSGKSQDNLWTTTSDSLQLPNTSSTQSGSLSTPMDAGIAEGAMDIIDYSQSLHDEMLNVFGGMTKVAAKIADSNQSLHDEVLDVFAGVTEVTGKIVDYNQSLLESGLGESTSPPGGKEPVEEADPVYPGYNLIFDPEAPEYDEDPEVVKQWQQAMLDQGYEITVDGDYGEKSVEVAKQFQADQGLEVDGIVGEETWEATFSGGVVEPPPGDYTTEVPLPSDSEINEGLTSPSADSLEELLGNPEDPNSEGQSLQVTQNVGPFEVTGLQPAVEALGRIFDKVEVEKPDLYEQLGSVGMLNVRPIEGTDTYSNHSWGAAIDMRIGDTEADLDKDGATYQGLVELEPYFNAENFYWGAEFSTNEDPIHFEASEELLAQWEAEGLLTA